MKYSDITFFQRRRQAEEKCGSETRQRFPDCHVYQSLEVMKGYCTINPITPKRHNTTNVVGNTHNKEKNVINDVPHEATNVTR